MDIFCFMLAKKQSGYSQSLMSLFHIFILSIVQGITEFLPISSSGHLILTRRILEGNEQGAWNESLVLDLAVHVGSLLSVLLYFRKDVFAMIRGGLHFASGKGFNDQARLALFLIAASVPAIAFGLTLHILQPGWMRSIEVVAWCTLVFGFLLWFVDMRSANRKTVADMNLKSAIAIGCAQALALIPGTSRSGVTMTMARHLGFTRPEAARFSFLLSIIATSAAGTIGALKMIEIDSPALTIDAACAVVFSFVASLFTIAFLMRWLQKATFTAFAVYRIGLGILLLVLIYTSALG
jgi:undecaprenyl-diphosphatase